MKSESAVSLPVSLSGKEKRNTTEDHLGRSQLSPLTPQPKIQKHPVWCSRLTVWDGDQTWPYQNSCRGLRRLERARQERALFMLGSHLTHFTMILDTGLSSSITLARFSHDCLSPIDLANTAALPEQCALHWRVLHAACPRFCTADTIFKKEREKEWKKWREHWLLYHKTMSNSHKNLYASTLTHQGGKQVFFVMTVNFLKVHFKYL